MRTQSICLALAIVLLCPFASAQWAQMGLTDQGIGKIAVSSSRLFAVTTDSGWVFRSTVGGTHWSQIVQSYGRHIAVAPNGTTLLSMGNNNIEDGYYVAFPYGGQR
jgi:hypothetical protein